MQEIIDSVRATDKGGLEDDSALLRDPHILMTVYGIINSVRATDKGGLEDDSALRRDPHIVMRNAV